MAEFSVREGTVVTLRQEEEIEVEEGPIHVVPAWWWATTLELDQAQIQ